MQRKETRPVINRTVVSIGVSPTRDLITGRSCRFTTHAPNIPIAFKAYYQPTFAFEECNRYFKQDRRPEEELGLCEP